MVTFASSLESISVWRASRMPLARYVPLAALIAWAATVAAAPSEASGPRGPQFAAALVLAFTLIAQFRLWDDLADRDRDRERNAGAHGDRMLVRVRAIAPFVWISVMLAVFNSVGLALLRGWTHALGVLVLSALVLVWYRAHRERGLAHAHVLLLKYPAFVALLAITPAHGPILTIAAALVYCALCAFEIMDDSGLRGEAGSALLVLHSAVLAAAPLVVRVDLIACLTGVLTGLVFVALWQHARQGGEIGAARYLPFLAAAIDFVFITSPGIA